MPNTYISNTLILFLYLIQPFIFQSSSTCFSFNVYFHYRPYCFRFFSSHKMPKSSKLQNSVGHSKIVKTCSILFLHLSYTHFNNFLFNLKYINKFSNVFNVNQLSLKIYYLCKETFELRQKHVC